MSPRKSEEDILWLRLVRGSRSQIFFTIGVFLSWKFIRKTPVLEFLKGLKLYLNEAPTQIFSCELSQIFKNTYIEEHLQTTASFFLLPLLNIADSHYCYTANRWSRRSTNFKAIVGFLTDLEFMPISASWNIN